MTKTFNNNFNQEECELKQEAKNNFWYSIALLIGNVGIIVKILAELISDRDKSN